MHLIRAGRCFHKHDKVHKENIYDYTIKFVYGQLIASIC